MTRRRIGNEVFEVLVIVGVLATVQPPGAPWAGSVALVAAAVGVLLLVRLATIAISASRSRRAGERPPVEPPSHWRTVRTWRYLRFGLPGVALVALASLLPTGWALLVGLTGVVLLTVPLPSYPRLGRPALDPPPDLRLTRWTGAR